MRFYTLFICLSLSLNAFAQQTYTNKKEDTHYCGPVTEAQLRSGDFAEWFTDEDPEFDLPTTAPDWANNLNDAKVEIFLGTWCGDSKTWVPRFINYWTAAGLDANQLSFVALYDGDEKYKQGPAAEEKGLNIHRVPTFVFSREGEEFARIVEHPVTTLETDLAQIALGHPVRPSYAGANAMWELLDSQPIDSIYAHGNEHLRKIYRLASRSSELNTLGYVLLRAGELDKARTAFHFNTIIYRYDPNTHDSYGEVLALSGMTDEAIKSYEKVLAFKPEDENALAQLKELREKLEKEGE
jgi:tetratricopeptide (TPR) repeat protein